MQALQAQPPATRARLGVLALLAAGTMINYLDRTVLGLAAPALTKELSIGPLALGWIFSAFSWSYVAAQIPGGIFLDRFGSRLTYGLAVTLWSVFTLLHGLTGGVASLFAFRICLGISEAPCFPTNIRVVGTWFPQRERARATAVYTVGEYVGLAFLSPALYWIMAHFGWRSLFVILGSAGMVFGGVWWARYREPDDSRANGAELSLIHEGGSFVRPRPEATRFSWASLKALLRHRQIWGVCLGQFGGNSTLVFFLTWFPSYLATERHMGWIKLGSAAILPFLAASLGVLTGGWCSDVLLRRTGSASLARKLPVISGLLLGSSMILANYVSSDAAVIAVMSVAFFGQGLVGLGFALVADIAPRHLAGLTSGLCNVAANAAGILTPLVVGLILQKTGSFAGALAYIAGAAFVGALAYLVVLGEVKRIEVA